MKSQLISYLELLRPIPEEDARIIDTYFEPASYKEGDVLFPGQRVCNNMFFISNGVMRIVTVNDRGIDITHYFYRENQICTILPSFNDGSFAEAGIRAACDVSVLSVTRDKLLELYGKLPYMKELIDRVNQQRLIEKVHLRNAYIGQDAESQYRTFMLQHADIASRVPLKDIASFLGITPQSLSRIRKNIR